MTRRLASLAEVADQYDAIVLDQWGVLHNGSVPYPDAPATLTALQAEGTRFAVLSNSGKRSAPNAARIAAMGFPHALFAQVMTSGEALWQDIAAGRIAERRLFPIERAPGDAQVWADGLDVTLVADPAEAEAILLMGLPDGVDSSEFEGVLATAMASGQPVICTNPDRASPRADGQVVVSPGALAHAHADAGGTVRFYGKPHLPVFRALELALQAAPERLLMVGDSLEHDIAGGHKAGWSTAFVEGGLHARHFANDNPDNALAALVTESAVPAPDFTLPRLQ
ncbi:MAG: TIGR01459 family HAD-type hydrolase [Pseudomonadota bacterium]